MNIDERLEALTHTVELMASMQQETEKTLQTHIKTTERNLNRLTREVRLFRHFVLAMGANIESRLLKLEDDDNQEDEGEENPER